MHFIEVLFKLLIESHCNGNYGIYNCLEKNCKLTVHKHDKQRCMTILNFHTLGMSVFFQGSWENKKERGTNKPHEPLDTFLVVFETFHQRMHFVLVRKDSYSENFL